MNISLATSHASSKPLLPFTAAKLPKDQQKFVSFPFKLSSDLSEHELFQLPRLAELVHYVGSQTPDEVTCVVRGRTKDRNCPPKIDCERATELIAQAQETGVLILIKNAQYDPEYRALLNQIVDELEKLTEQPLSQQSTWFETYIFITPCQNRRLNFESSFLFLLHEDKEISWQNKDHSIFISLISLPGEDRTVSVNLFALKSAPFNSKKSSNKRERNQALTRKNVRNCPPQVGARLGKDLEGNPAWFIPDPARPGKYLQVGTTS